MKLISKLMILLLLAVSCSLQAQDQAQGQGRIVHPKGLLWKIEKPGLQASYLYGTMHVGDPRVVNLPPPVEAAFNQADRFAMEMLLNFRAMGVVTEGSFFNDGRTLASLMQAADYQRLLGVFNRHMDMALPDDVIKHMKPWAVLVMLMMPGKGEMQGDSPLDMVLYRRAALRRIPLLGLETPEEQLAVFDVLNLDDQIWLLNQSVKDYSKNSRQLPLMLEAYLNRDLAALVKLQQQYMYNETDIDDRLMLALLDRRNQRMVVRMQDFLQQGNAFIAIGALHLPGDKGVLYLLEQQGYRVEAVY